MSFAFFALPEPTNYDAISALPGAPVLQLDGNQITVTRRELGGTRAWARRSGPAVGDRLSLVAHRVVTRVRPPRRFA